MHHDITTVIAEFIQSNFVFDDTTIQPDESFMDAGLIDSTGILEVVLFLEETFGITVDDDDVLPEHFDSIARLSAYARGKLDGAKSRDTVLAAD